MIDEINATDVVVEDVQLRALVDTGSGVSTITDAQCKRLGIPIHPLEAFLPNCEVQLVSSNGTKWPYSGCALIELSIPTLPEFKTQALFFVVNETAYTKQVPVYLGIDIVDEMLQHVTEECTDKAIRRAKIARVVSNSISTETVLPKPFPVKTTKVVTLNANESKIVHGIVKTPLLSKSCNVVVEPDGKGLEHKSVTCAPSYAELNPGSKRVPVCLRNLGNQPVRIEKGQLIGQVQMANVVPQTLVTKKEEQKDQSEIVLEKLDLSGLDEVEPDQKQAAIDLVKKYQHLFSVNSLDLGKTELVKHKIEITDSTPFRERYRRIPPQMFDQVKAHLEEMLSMGAIRRSHSPWASAIVLVKKKDGGIRFCIDLRQLNNRTVKDAYTLPRIDESLDCLRGSNWFSSLDLKSGYWQVELEEDSKPLTAFTVGPLGFYECERMPFGLANAPATFQRVMQSCLGELHLQYCIIYLDDVVVYSRTFQEHLERLEAVFKKLEQAGLKLKPSKCELFKQRITYLGHVVSKDGVGTCSDKTEAIRKWPVPKTVTDVRSFLGFVGYYRRFIEGFSQVSRPLVELTCGPEASRGGHEVTWTEECQQAFETLKEACSTSPVLAYADFSRPFKVYTDASGLGLGATIYQEQVEGPDRVVAYASRSLSRTEAKYPAHKLEFLALKWAITEKFHEYLYGSKFTVYTDNNPLTYVLSTAKLDATRQRWIAALALYDFDIKYRSGKVNIDADALSRIRWENEETVIHIPQSGVQTILDGNGVTSYEMWANTVSCIEIQKQEVENVQEIDWRQEQANDPILGSLMSVMRGNELERPIYDPDGELQYYLKHKGEIKIRQNILYRRIKRGPYSISIWQLLLPPKYRCIALQGCHDNAGHPAESRTLSILADRFFWPKMNETCQKYVHNCLRCKAFKAMPEIAPLETIPCVRPLQVVHMDYLTIEDKGNKIANILVITDHFTRFAQAYVTSSQTAKVTAKAIWDQFMVHYGCPENIITDQGRNFESILIAELCKLAGVKKLRTTPYHPMANGQCERFNRTLISMLGTLPPQKKSKWKEYVKPLVFMYNATKSEATGYSPYKLMFGREPRLPVDSELNVPVQGKGHILTADYVIKLKQQLEWARQQAELCSRRQINRHKKIKDRRVKGSTLQVGDRVLVRVTSHAGKHKIQDRWNIEPYEVVGQPYKGIPVYKVQQVGDPSKFRVLHRNLLLSL